MAKPTAPWFEAMIWVELLFQVPFFAFATAGFVARRNSVRIPCIIYGTSAATSVVPILGDILASDEVTDPQRYKLISICEEKQQVNATTANSSRSNHNSCLAFQADAVVFLRGCECA